MKGLALGLLIGSMLTGTAAYAAGGKTINVIMKELKFKLDGTEKPDASATGILYKNAWYVPVRSVAEAIGKPVKYDDKTATVSIGADGIAVYKGGTVTQAEYDAFVSANSFYFGQGAPSDKTQAVKQLIAIRLLAAKQEAKFGQEADAAAADSLRQLAAYFGSAEKLASQLKTANLTEAQLKRFVREQFLAGKALESMADAQAVQAEYDRIREADSAAFVVASVRHILIATTDNATGKALRTEDEALARAKDVQAELKAGGDFAKLAKEYSDDPGSKDGGGLYADADLAQFVEPFKKAGAELPLNQISDPVQSAYGYHVMKVESRTVLALDQVKDTLVQSLMGRLFQNFIDAELPKLVQSIKFPANP